MRYFGLVIYRSWFRFLLVALFAFRTIWISNLRKVLMLCFIANPDVSIEYSSRINIRQCKKTSNLFQIVMKIVSKGKYVSWCKLLSLLLHFCPDKIFKNSKKLFIHIQKKKNYPLKRSVLGKVCLIGEQPLQVHWIFFPEILIILSISVSAWMCPSVCLIFSA